MRFSKAQRKNKRPSFNSMRRNDIFNELICKDHFVDRPTFEH